MTDRSHVVLVGDAGSLGRRVAALLATADDVGEVVAADSVESLPGDLDALLAGASAVVHLAFDAEAAVDDPGGARRDVNGAGRLFAAAFAAGVRQLVVVTGASVYGAWPSSSIPITEDAPLRPNVGAGDAVQLAEIERLAAEVARADPTTRVAVLRPAVAVAGGEWSWLARSLNLARGMRAVDADPPFQLLHLDDLAAAVDHARRAGLDGVYNVAPDGWMSGEEVRALAGDPPRLRLPAWWVAGVASLRWRARVGRMPPGLVPYTMHPFVVANDKLKATGWAPTRTNQETYVEATPGTPWSQVSPKRRQELALGVTGSLGLGGIAAVASLLFRRRRDR